MTKLIMDRGNWAEQNSYKVVLSCK